VGVLRPGRDRQAVRQARLLDHQRMVAGGIEGIVETAEYAFAPVVYGRDLAVHDAGRTHDAATKSGADALVAQAYAKQGDASGEMLDCGHRNARLVGRAGTGRDDDVAGRKRLDLGKA